MIDKVSLELSPNQRNLLSIQTLGWRTRELFFIHPFTQCEKTVEVELQCWNIPNIPENLTVMSFKVLVGPQKASLVYKLWVCCDTYANIYRELLAFSKRKFSLCSLKRCRAVALQPLKNPYFLQTIYNIVMQWHFTSISQ